MKLAEFLSTALATGHARVRIASTARGHEVHRGELAGASAEHLEALCIDDAAPLTREGTHEYGVTVESEDGSKASRFTVRVHGGAAPQEEHRVDPREVTNAGAVTGHLVRLIVDQQKSFVTLASRILERDENEMKELGRLRRSLARRGTDEIASKALDIEASERAADRGRNDMMLGKLLGMAEPLMTRMLPGGDAVALASFRASLSEPQLSQLAEVLGVGRFGKFLTLGSAAAVATWVLDEVSGEDVRDLMAVFTDNQRGLITAALRPEMDRRTKAKAAADAKANTGASSPNGAPS